MKKNLLTICLILLLSLSSRLFAQRYLTEVFTNTTVTKDVVFGRNYSVLLYVSGGPIYMDTLKADVYEPVGDTLTARPTVFLLHPGSAIPIFYNYWCTGIKEDSAVAEMCRQFARRGYTAIALNYRQGWNPTSPDQDVRTGGLLQALGRAIQDVKAAVRYFRNDAMNANTYHIDPNMFILGGLSTGGTIAMNYATLHNYSQIQLIKFLSASNNSLYHFNIGTTYFDSTYWGNFDGYGGNPALNYSGNTPGVSNAIQFAFNLQGAIGDSSWLHAGDVPVVCFHSMNDATSPYYCGPIYSIGQYVVDVCGSHMIIQRSDNLNNNISFQNNSWTDPFTVTANQRNDGYDGLFPFTTATQHSAPWEWWDSTTVFQTMMFGLGFTLGHADTVWYNSIADNPDMSSARGHAYLDSIMGYLNPRIFNVITTGISELSQIENNLSVYPNPASNEFNIRMSEPYDLIRFVRIYDITGRMVKSLDKINSESIRVETKSYESGMYLLKIGFDKGEVIRKVLLN